MKWMEELLVVQLLFRKWMGLNPIFFYVSSVWIVDFFFFIFAVLLCLSQTRIAVIIPFLTHFSITHITLHELLFSCKFLFTFWIVIFLLFTSLLPSYLLDLYASLPDKVTFVWQVFLHLSCWQIFELLLMYLLEECQK